MKQKCRLFLIGLPGFIWFFCLYPAAALQEALPVFNRLTIRDGLSDNEITCFLKDRAGLLWVGTYGGGLNCYDGDSFTVFENEPGNSSSLAHNIVTAIGEDSKGLLWIGTEGGGLDCLDRRTMQFTHYKNDTVEPGSLISDYIRAIVVDSSDRLWIGTGSGLDRFDRNRKKFSHYVWKNKDENSLISNNVKFLYMDSSGVLWIGTNIGINRYRPEMDDFVRYRASLSEGILRKTNITNVMYEDKNHNLWIGTQGGGLLRFAREEEKYAEMYTDVGREGAIINGLVITAIGEDSQGNFWVSTMNGWNLFDPEKKEFPEAYLLQANNPDDLAQNLFTTIYTDRDGITWIGTMGGIIAVYPQLSVFRRYSTSTDNSGLHPDSITGFCKDANQRLWIATQNQGIKCADRQSGKVLSYRYNPALPDGLPDNRVTALFNDQAGIIWIGTEKGLACFSEEQHGFIRPGLDAAVKNVLTDTGISAFYRDRAGRLWVATAGSGIFRLDRQTGYAEGFTLASLNAGTIHVFCEDREGRLWAGTDTGVERFDGITNSFVHYQLPSQGNTHDPAKTRVFALYEDSTGTLWAGTAGNGLYHYKQPADKFLPFIEGRNLVNAGVLAILEDNKHNLWLAMEQGLCRLDPVTGNNFLFDRSHGLPEGSFNPGAAFEDTNGEVFLGTTEGYCSFFPDTLDPALLTAPDVMLTSFSQDGKAVPLFQFPERTKQIELINGKGYLAFTFCANAPLYSLENHYAYRLLGYEQEWHYCGTVGRGSYLNLPDKSYTLELKSSSPQGSWNGKTASVRIAFTRIQWDPGLVFAVLAVVLGLATFLFVIIVLLKNRQLKRKRSELEKEQQISEGLRKLDKLKDEFLAATSHELRTPLNGMINLAEALLSEASLERGAADTLAVIVSSGRRLSNLINDILDFSKLKTGNLEIIKQPVNVKLLADFVLKLTRVQAAHKPLAFSNLVPETIPLVLGDEERIQQILFNLVGNAVKFTEQGKVEITAVWDERQVELTVTDTGSGIPAGQLEEIFLPFRQGADSYRGTGLGLYITKQLVILHGGSLSVESAPGLGSAFRFSLPVCSRIPAPGAAPRNTFPAALLPDGWRQPDFSENTQQATDAVTLLIIDDEPVNQLALAGQLATGHYRLLQAYDGEEGLRCINGGKKPDLVILDLMLPKIDGFEVCRRIRMRYKPYELPVIMITAKNRVEDMIMGLGAGANDYLSRPFSRSELLARVKTQLSLARYDLLKELAEQKTHFFINLAHETRTPLTLIGNYLENYIAKHGMDDDLQGMKTHIGRLTADILNFLDYEKLQKGQVFYDHSRVCDLSAVTGHLLAMFREAALRRGVSIESRVAEGVCTRADPAAIERIITNLLDNAVKFTAVREGEEAKCIQVLLEKRKKNAVFVVKDNGIGIPAHARAHIFERYFQVSHQKRSIRGNGMGLALVSAITEQLKGTVGVESAENRGSTFTVTFNLHTPAPGDTAVWHLPAVHPVCCPVTVPVEEPGRPGKFNILIAEDKVELLAFMHSRMKEQYNIYLALNGREALEKLKRIPCPDLIISDVMMDEMDGYEFFGNLAEDERYRMIPFIIITARGAPDEKLRSLHRGVLDYIYKPFLMDELLARIDSMLRYEQMRKNYYERDKYAAFGTLLSGISHELLNPLSGITGPIANFRKYLEDAGKNDAKCVHYLSMMEKNTRRISNLIKSLKALYYHQDEVRKEAINFNRIVQSLVELFSTRTRERIRIETEVAEDFMVTANPSILTHILINLVSNAIDSINGRGVVRIAATGGNALPVIHIIDTGQGMSREIIANIFNPFFTTKSDAKGLGLGLYIVKDLVMRMGWELDVNSEPGKGSEFMIRVVR